MGKSRGIREVACIDSDRVQSNDVTVDERGLLHLPDRVRGQHILERT